jgi:hypothetical protein
MSEITTAVAPRQFVPSASLLGALRAHASRSPVNSDVRPHVKPRLSETEDRLLAMADDEWTDLATAKAVLESWFAVPLAAADLQRLLSALLSQGLVSCTIKSQPATASVLHLPEDLSLVEFKATGKGVRYLAEDDGGHAV